MSATTGTTVSAQGVGRPVPHPPGTALGATVSAQGVALPDTAIAHDELVARIAAHAFDTRVFAVYTNTQRTLQRPVKGQYPHLVAVGKVDQRVEIVGMVETVDSLHDLDAAARRWRPLEHLQAAVYLYVPRGYCTDARALCLRQYIRISDFRHYWFEGDEGPNDPGPTQSHQLHVERCFA